MGFGCGLITRDKVSDFLCLLLTMNSEGTCLVLTLSASILTDIVEADEGRCGP